MAAIAKAAASLSFLQALIVPHDLSSFSDTSCLVKHFYGSYPEGLSMRNLYIPDLACLATLPDTLASSSLGPKATIMPSQDHSLVWLYKQDVDADLVMDHPTLNDVLSKLRSAPSYACSGDTTGAQVPLSGSTRCDQPSYEVLSQTQNSTLLSLHVQTARTIDTILPPFWQSSIIPSSPLTRIPVPDNSVAHIKDLLAKLKFNPIIAAIVEDISVPQMRNDIRYLTGEDSTSEIVSRHSLASGSRVAAAWLKERFEDTGATCQLKRFLEGYAPNVVCRYASATNTTSTILLSAHYDSRGSFGSTRAPGGDDDGSGTTSLLAMARAIARNNVTFNTNVELVAFAGEEQGLLGSRAYARELRSVDANLTLMIQADMLAYHKPGEPAQLGLPAYIGTPEVANLVANVSALYSPELTVGITYACCSDHQSFHEQGFAATQVFERAGPIADPMYHNSGDLSERKGYDLEQVKSIAKVQLATLLHAAGFTV
ncbi:hypothetical protein HGRIS_001001 [Hohenbuehelia grisea]|uniref:Peptide hydrolase n=1 Tax=Hohenbuehelia grisea TaxID=104357 RepID=A0ABR3IQE3_9AGAR